MRFSFQKNSKISGKAEEMNMELIIIGKLGKLKKKCSFKFSLKFSNFLKIRYSNCLTIFDKTDEFSKMKISSFKNIVKKSQIPLFLLKIHFFFYHFSNTISLFLQECAARIEQLEQQSSLKEQLLTSIIEDKNLGQFITDNVSVKRKN